MLSQENFSQSHDREIVTFRNSGGRGEGVEKHESCSPRFSFLYNHGYPNKFTKKQEHTRARGLDLRFEQDLVGRN